MILSQPIPAACADLAERAAEKGQIDGFFVCLLIGFALMLVACLIAGTMDSKSRAMRRYTRAVNRRANQYIALGMYPRRAYDLVQTEMEAEAAAALGVET